MANRDNHTKIFRQKSLNSVASPENLDRYIKSTTPSLWLLLGAVTVLLMGVIVWGTFGKIDSASVVGCRAEKGVVTAFIREEEGKKLCEESYIEINGERCAISSVTGPAIAGESSDAFLVQAAEIKSGAWYYTVTGTTELADGEYKGRVVYEKISPISFVIN